MAQHLERKLQVGNAITRIQDQLREVSLQRLHEGICRSKEELRDTIEQLRALRSVSEQQYRELKKKLPYFVCGIFYPPVRRAENLSAMHYLLLDLDHLGAIETTPAQLRQRLRTDPRLVMDFVSPGGDGLKLLFALSEPIFDAELFKLLYKWFASQFAEKYQLAEVVDMRTHDPTRACFLSYDPQARLNNDALPIDVAAFQQMLESGQLREIQRQLRKERQKSVPKADQPTARHSALDDETLQRIKQRLNFKQRKKTPPAREVPVPREVRQALQYLENTLPSDYEMQIEGKKPIQYGMQIRLRAGDLWAEINLFYGQKRGYSIVPTTRTGSNQELARLAAEVIRQTIEEMLNEAQDEPHESLDED